MGSDTRLWIWCEGVAVGCGSSGGARLGDVRPASAAMRLQLWREGLEPDQGRPSMQGQRRWSSSPYSLDGDAKQPRALSSSSSRSIPVAAVAALTHCAAASSYLVPVFLGMSSCYRASSSGRAPATAALATSSTIGPAPCPSTRAAPLRGRPTATVANPLQFLLESLRIWTLMAAGACFGYLSTPIVAQSQIYALITNPQGSLLFQLL
ncbi:unnamed protein product [Urochloa humidicola]